MCTPPLPCTVISYEAELQGGWVGGVGPPHPYPLVVLTC